MPATSPGLRTRIWTPITTADAAAFLLLAAAVMGAAYAYTAHERYLYFWDWAGFHAVAADFTEQLMAEPRAGLELFRRSLAGEYTLVFALPLIPVLALSEGARTPYILSVAGLYLLPFAVLAGVVCRRSFPELGRTAFWGGAVLAIAVPPVWLSVMRGYPDVLAAALVIGALALVMRDLRLQRWRTIFAVAFLLAAAVVIRRHVLFAALAVLGTVALLLLRHEWDLRRAGTPAMPTNPLGTRLLRALALPIATVALLALLQPVFFVNLVRQDYGNLYASYQQPTRELLSLFQTRTLGPVFFAIGGSGFVLGIVRGRLRCTPDTALTLYGLLWLTAWVLIVRQQGPHHLVVGLPLIVSAGVLQVASVARVRGWRKPEMAWLAAVAGYTLLNALATNGPDRSLHVAAQRQAGILSVYSGPLRRADFDEVRALIAALRDGPQPVLVAASNGRLNFDLVRKAEPRLFGKGKRRLAVLDSPQVDSRDPLPVDELLRTGQVVVVTPFQFHLERASEQDVVRVLLDAFAEDWPIARDFRRLDESFVLEGGVVAQVYQRERAASLPTAIDTYRRMVAATEEPVAPFRDSWFWSGSAQPPGLLRGRGGEHSFYQLGPTGPGAVALTLLRPLRGPHRITGTVHAQGPGCSAVLLEAVGARSAVVYGRMEAPAAIPTDFAFEVDGNAFVQLTVRSLDPGACDIDLLHVRVAAVP
jgi:hypothetical protein